MDFWTVVLRKSDNYWVALCLENGTVGQGVTEEDTFSCLTPFLTPFLTIPNFSDPTDFPTHAFYWIT
jgi:hypothetical protein